MPTVTLTKITLSFTASDPRIFTQASELGPLEVVGQRFTDEGLGSQFPGGIYTSARFVRDKGGDQFTLPLEPTIPYLVVEPISASPVLWTSTGELFLHIVRLHAVTDTFEDAGAKVGLLRSTYAFAPIPFPGTYGTLIECSPNSVRYFQDDEAVWRGMLELRILLERPVRYNPT